MSEIECRSVWKLFGERAVEALRARRTANLSNEEIRTQYGSVVAVQDVSFSVEKGEIFCIMGLSGSGKSTLIRHINRLVEPTAGDILIQGISINALNDVDLRRLRSEKIGMVFQHMALWPHRTIRDTVAFGLEVRGVDKPTRHAAARRALENVNLADWESQYPDQLSGGMQQRVGLARALASDPDILLMDEPFSALDPLIRRQLQDQFLDLAEKLKKTTLFITHDLDEAIRLGNRIAIMKEGRIVQVGTPQEILNSPKDDYVRAFVENVSHRGSRAAPLPLTTASAVMLPLGGAEYATAQVRGIARSVAADAGMDVLIERFLELDDPIQVVNPDGAVVGLVTKASVLETVRTRQATDPVARA